MKLERHCFLCLGHMLGVCSGHHFHGQLTICLEMLHEVALVPGVAHLSFSLVPTQSIRQLEKYLRSVPTVSSTPLTAVSAPAP